MAYISETTRQRVREAFADRCAYCQCSQSYVYGKLEIEHIYPESRGGTNEEVNLCLACRTCNLFKSDQVEAVDPLTGSSVPLFNPRRQDWSEHFRWAPAGTTILGRTPVGRATVRALGLNNELAVAVRREWVRVGWHPPENNP
jgi:hypothetical protein